MFGLGVQELIIILVIVLIFFGAEKIPQLAKSLGKGVSEFKKAQQDLKQEITKEPERDTVAAAIDNSTVNASVTCPSCNGETTSGSVFCSQCGKRIISEDRCGLCQRQLQAHEKYCPNCGNSREN